jgi:hypothetical protein
MTLLPGVPKMANMLEGGGSTPICSPAELEDMGFKVWRCTMKPVLKRVAFVGGACAEWGTNSELPIYTSPNAKNGQSGVF